MIFTWMETFLYIRTKQGNLEVFSMNTIQEIFAQHVAECWHKGVSVVVWIPKSRQQGSSTFWQLLLFAMCEVIAGFRAAVVAHDENGARAVFSRAFTCLRQLRKRGEWPEPTMLNEQGGMLLWDTESSFESGTIKTGAGLGLGGTPNAVHYSEVSRFCDKGINAKKAVNALNNAVPEHRWKIIVYESTADGKDPFFWPGCEDSRDPQSGSTASLIFLPWFLEVDYSMSWAQYRKELIAAGKPDPGATFVPTEEEVSLRDKLLNARVRPEEKNFRYQYNLSDHQLIWRRWAIVNKCSNDIDEFKKYYPSFYEEAFTASAACAFDNQAIDYYRNLSKPPIATGVLSASHSGPIFERRRNYGPIHIWEFPLPGADYVIGADPGGKRKKSDPYSAYVVNKDTLETVASLHGRFEWDHFADMLVQLGYFYNTAQIVVENNHRPAIAQRVHRANYPNLFYYFDRDTARAREGKTPGFNTNKKTRKSLVDTIRRACRKRILTIYDPEFWREMENFVWVPSSNAINPATDGQYRATGTNTDDRIMSLSLALLQCPQPEVESYEGLPEHKPSHAYRMLLQFQEEERIQQAGDFLQL